MSRPQRRLPVRVLSGQKATFAAQPRMKTEAMNSGSLRSCDERHDQPQRPLHQCQAAAAAAWLTVTAAARPDPAPPIMYKLTQKLSS